MRRVVIELFGCTAGGFLVGLWIAHGVQAGALVHAASQAGSPSNQQATATAGRVFGSDAGMVLNFIKPDKTADFEAIVTKLKEALDQSPDPLRKQQAAGFRVFRAVEPAAGGNVVYVFVVDPAVPGADYTVSTILAEAFPNEVQALYQQYAGAYAAGQNFVNLRLIAALSEHTTQ